MAAKLESRAALVLALIALSVALGGNAFAQVAGSGGHSHKIKRGEIAKGAVTASALARGSVRGRALRKGAVGPNALRAGAVTEPALANSIVTARVMAANSVYGFELGPVETVSTPIKDPDVYADQGTWTNSNTEAATCPQGARLLSGGVGFTNPGNRRVGTIVSVPSVNGGTNTWQGGFTSDSGGLAEAQVQALCLKAGP